MLKQVETLSLIIKADSIDTAINAASMHKLCDMYDIYRINKDEFHIKVILKDNLVERYVQEWFKEQNKINGVYPIGTLLVYSYHYETMEI